MIQPLTPIEINSVRELLANPASGQRSVSWGDIRYAKKAAPNLLRQSGSFVTAYEGKRVEFDLAVARSLIPLEQEEPEEPVLPDDTSRH